MRDWYLHECSSIGADLKTGKLEAAEVILAGERVILGEDGKIHVHRKNKVVTK